MILVDADAVLTFERGAITGLTWAFYSRVECLMGTLVKSELVA